MEEHRPKKLKGLEFERRGLIVRDGKGAQFRVTVLPDSLLPPRAVEAATARLTKL